eukprot:TRINITY_DN1878_c1_g2_i2.p1 TRINITY_DN1878_c1_g2~~TRINITY_DN1878_c1_g2_i2.p1  ORF type:complete len:123 (-),score=10.90 TRINITY_DN1878_c1_g2_i2:135-503(-)
MYPKPSRYESISLSLSVGKLWYHSPFLGRGQTVSVRRARLLALSDAAVLKNQLFKLCAFSIGLELGVIGRVALQTIPNGHEGTSDSKRELPTLDLPDLLAGDACVEGVFQEETCELVSAHGV